MVSTNLSIKLASKDPNWNQYDVATKAALAISIELSDRRGFDLSALEKELLKEILDSWADLIRELLGQEVSGKL